MTKQSSSGYRLLLWLSEAGTIALLSAGQPGLTQQADLPPPPFVSEPSQGDTSRNAPASEQVFQAPASLQAAPVQRYAVVVNGNSSYLLELVQKVAPEAKLQQHQGHQVIQVGEFESQSAAQQQVTALDQQGIRSQVFSEAELNQNISRYVVIVPGSQAELASLTQQAVRLGVRSEAIQSRDRPLGTHLEIGSFVDRGEAEAVSRSLRGGGLDARVVFR
ncbi:MAG TPA: hypothetical protein V6D18_18950 [Thermosynechococcaceae cyanobacterium]